MKKFNIAILSASVALAASCTDMKSLADGEFDKNAEVERPVPPRVEDPEPEVLLSWIEKDKALAANVALRERKATPGLPQVFVWFDGWAGRFNTGATSLRGLPVEVTIASNWGGHPKFLWPDTADDPAKSLSEQRRADMKYVQDVYGTKVVVTLFSAHCGDDMEADPIYNIGNSSDEAVIRPAIKKYAKAIYEACIRSGYDGFDWDFEPDASGQGASAPLWFNPTQAGMFVEELSYWFGTGAQDATRDRGDRGAMPEKRLLFLIDGEVHDSSMKKDWQTYYVDYFVQQAYGQNTAARAEDRVAGILTQMGDHIEAGRVTRAEVVRRSILAEDFESNGNSGGGVLIMAGLVCTEEESGIDHQVGGFGIYRVGFDFKDDTQKWNFLPQGIKILYDTYNARQAAGKDIYPN